jgi:hypothetical protein
MHDACEEVCMMHVKRTLAYSISTEMPRREEYEYAVFMLMHASVFMYMYKVH